MRTQNKVDVPVEVEGNFASKFGPAGPLSFELYQIGQVELAEDGFKIRDLVFREYFAPDESNNRSDDILEYSEPWVS